MAAIRQSAFDSGERPRLYTRSALVSLARGKTMMVAARERPSPVRIVASIDRRRLRLRACARGCAQQPRNAPRATRRPRPETKSAAPKALPATTPSRRNPTPRSRARSSPQSPRDDRRETARANSAHRAPPSRSAPAPAAAERRCRRCRRSIRRSPPPLLPRASRERMRACADEWECDEAEVDRRPDDLARIRHKAVSPAPLRRRLGRRRRARESP